MIAVPIIARAIDHRSYLNPLYLGSASSCLLFVPMSKQTGRQ